MNADDIFSRAGFDNSLEPAFQRIRQFIEAPNGCNAKLYKPPKMKQARAAHIAPGENGVKARQVFVMIHPRKNAMLVLRRAPYRKGKPKDQGQLLIDSAFSEWERLERSLREWSFDPRQPKKPKVSFDFGDGKALAGGLPETNHSKF